MADDAYRRDPEAYHVWPQRVRFRATCGCRSTYNVTIVTENDDPIRAACDACGARWERVDGSPRDIAIREAWATGAYSTQTELAAHLGVHQTVVSKALKGVDWQRQRAETEADRTRRARARLALSYREDRRMTFEQIGAALGVSAVRARQIYHRAAKERQDPPEP